MQIEKQDAKKILKAITDEALELILLPTEKCNFRCVYCYEDFAIGKMKPHIIQGIRALIQNRVEKGLKHLRISWFGGEPLLAQNIVSDLSQFITELVGAYPNLKYESAMTTNGYLLDVNMLEKLVMYGVNDFQISLDGTPEIHDKTRLRADGNGTFEKIWNNLLEVKKTNLDFKVMFRIHVTPDNLESLPKLVSMVQNEFSVDPRFRIFFKTIEDLGGPNSKTFEVVHKKNRQQVMQGLYDLVHEKMKIEKIESLKPYICYAAQANSFMIRANGRVGKCTVALDDERNDIGYIMPNGSINIDSDKLRPWIRGLSNLDLGNLACPLVNLPKGQATLGKHILPVHVA